MRSITLHFLGRGHKPLLKCCRCMPHPHMEKRKEFNIHILGYRIAITWEVA